VDDFGCIQHPEHSFIGASPDGINTDPSNKERYGRMVEIKNIVNREITGVPKEEYWDQTQVQMETCGLEECDFVETRFKEYTNEEEFYKDETRDYKGVILHFMKRTSNMSQTEIVENLSSVNTPVYKYMPVNGPMKKRFVDAWISCEKRDHSEDLILFNTIYWYLDEFSCVLIERNRRWFAAALPQIRDTWSLIMKERVDGYEHRAAKKRTVKTDINVQVEKSDETTTQTIRNLPMTNSICLVKLDSAGENIFSAMI
jgi:hypothetical protein